VATKKNPGLSSTSDPILRVVDAIGGAIEFWGFKRNMGRLWALLYLEHAPLSAADIGERLAMSTGAVSMTIGELLQWGVIKKTWLPGERRDYYAPETSIWKMVSRVFRERELTQIREAIEAFERAIATLEKQRTEAGPERRRQLQFVLDRISGLLGMARVGERLLSAMLSGLPVDASPLKQFTSDE
jgi:DNA-binding transcriptional regulator GbsR (MarR family)